MTILFVKAQVYVKFDAQGASNGKSWQDAYLNLDSAIVKTDTGQIWVAAGIYKPSINNGYCITFNIAKKISLFGGFIGSETNINQRDIYKNLTILSGDIGVEGNDLDNTPRVVMITGNNIDSTTIVDGFLITKSYYTNYKGYDYGNGALYIDCDGNPIIRNCIIKENLGYDGGGIYVQKSSPLIINNIITNNLAYEGAGIYNDYGAYSKIINNRITNNKCIGGFSHLTGGGIKIEAYSSPYIYGNLIDNNYAGNFGGGIANESNYSATISNNIISNNISVKEGGGIYINFSPTQIVNNLIINNQSQNGGGIYVDYSPNTNSINNTIVNNSSKYSGSAVYLSAANMNFINTIIFNNPSPTDQPISIFIGRKDWFPKFKFCDIENGTDNILINIDSFWDSTFIKNSNYMDSIWKSGNFSSYPAFIDTSNRNYQLSKNSSCINAGIQDTVGLGIPKKDMLGNNRIFYDRIDVGCYEFDSLTNSIGFVQNIDSDIKLFPNPVHDILTLLLLKPHFNTTISIYSMSGVLLYNSEVNNNQNIVDMKNFDNGIYFVVISSLDKNETKKIIKQ